MSKRKPTKKFPEHELLFTFANYLRFKFIPVCPVVQIRSPPCKHDLLKDALAENGKTQTGAALASEWWYFIPKHTLLFFASAI